MLSIPIRSSEPDQEKAGVVTRKLGATDDILWPASAMHDLRPFHDPDRHDDLLFPPSFSDRLFSVMKWGALGNGIPMAAVNTHSIRIGGARLPLRLWRRLWWGNTSSGEMGIFLLPSIHQHFL